MTDDRLSLGIYHEIRRAMCGDVAAGALLADYARLLCKCGEPLPVLLRYYAPTGYEQSGSFEIIRDTCPRYGVDDGPDALEDC